MEGLKPVDAWSLQRIVRFVEDNHVTVLIGRDGKPGVCGEAGPVAEVLPHLKARRDEVLAHFKAVVGEPYRPRPTPPDPAALARARHAAFVAALDRAGKAGRPLWYLDGPAPKRYTPSRKVAIPPTCKYICVEGDAAWAEFPGWKLPEPAPFKFRKRYRSRWARSREESR